MITEIGIVSGEILTALDEIDTPLDIQQLFLYVDAPQDVITMGIGWLIREGYVHLHFENGHYFIEKQKRRCDKSNLASNTFGV